MIALIIGATGATGKDLVRVLLQDPDYSKVIVFVRRTTEISHAKLSEVITDFDKLETVSDAIKGDVLFSCLGTTLKAAGSKENQWNIDYEIPARFSEIAKRNGVDKIILLSSYGAYAASNVYYSKIKGKLEDHIENMAFDQYIIFRPGLLERENTDRLGEKISSALLKSLNSLGIARKFKPMPTLTLAEKMVKASKVHENGKRVIELDKIFAF
jgi:uncharacterized protein YbjT (DUF2867 family)